VSDLAALDAACKELGLTLMRGQKTQNYYSGTSACEHAIKVPGTNWEIGLLASKTGKGFDLAFDDYAYGANGGVIGKKLGNGLEKLKQAYAVNVAALKARAQGWMTHRTTLANGTVKLVMTGV
jgi:hypothetical protein